MQLTIENESPELHPRHQKGIVHIALKINAQPRVNTIDLFQLWKMSKKDVVDLVEELHEECKRQRTDLIGDLLLFIFHRRCIVKHFVDL